jgi:3-phosphoshikimate 1-carboxyvinyltransferase
LDTWNKTMEIEPCGPAEAVVRVPGSKSLTQRALLMAALAQGESQLRGALLCEDTMHLIRALRELGASIREEGHALRVQGTGGRLRNPGKELFLGNNGTGLRFLTSAVCLGQGTYKLTGLPRLCERPMGPLLGSLGQLGAQVLSESGNGCAPILVHATGGLEGGLVRLPASESSQYGSSLLICGALMRGGLVLELEGKVVSRPYLGMTIQIMRAFGVNVMEESPSRLRVPGAGTYTGCSLEIEGDLSSGSYFLAAAVLCGGRVRIEGVGAGTLQGDIRICQVLEEMGSRVSVGESWVQVEGRALAQGDLVVDLGDAPDLVPTVAVVAAVRPGRTRIARVAHLRFKESDRLAVLARELEKLGVQVEQLEDGLVIHGGKPHGGQIDPHGDHRIAMSFALLGLRVGGIRIQDPGCVAKSYPGFWEDLGRLIRS